MRHFERRAAGQFPYFKLAAWDPRSFTYRDGREAHASEAAAREAAQRPGQYRVSRVDESGRQDFDPFQI